MSMYKVGIVGAAGYTAGELIRILVNHPKVEISFLQSESQSGRSVFEVHKDLAGDMDHVFTGKVQEADVIFLCKGHGQSGEMLKSNPELLEDRIIDLSQDFRLNGDHDFVYGLPEVNREVISDSSHIANPGCFATGIQLGLIPAVKSEVIESEVHISGITGSTGAGQTLSETTHFTWRNNNTSVYKAFTHQHLQEIGETLTNVNPDFSSELNFIPYRGNFTRGIIISTYFDTSTPEEELTAIYRRYYQDHAFTHVIDKNPDIKMVVNTNKCLVYIEKQGTKALIISVIDNLLKGASGQAVQNMNIMLGLEETEGLKLKGSSF